MSQFPPGQNPFSDNPPPLNAPYNPNPYAPPAVPSEYLPPQQAGVDGLWRKGNVLIMHQLATLPPICVKSNQPAEQWLKRQLQWHNPWLALTALISPLIYILIALIMMRRATVCIGLTNEWMARRQTRMLIAWAIGLGGLAVAALGIGLGMSHPSLEGYLVLILPGMVLLVGSLIYGQYGCRMVYPTRITDTHVWIKGVNRDFLDRLPNWPSP